MVMNNNLDLPFSYSMTDTKQRLQMNIRLISTENLARHYQRGSHVIRALDGVTLNIGKGELVGVVGSSGSGKSTLLNLLAGLDTPSQGQVIVAGDNLAELSRHQLSRYRAEKVGMVFQNFNLIRHYSAQRNVEAALFFTECSRNDRKLRAAEVLDQVGLSDRADHRPADLSGGEQQRVAIARALVKRPTVILADEPTGNLDKENSQQIAALLAELNREGQTILLVTHDLALAESLCGRIIKLQYGQIVEESQ